MAGQVYLLSSDDPLLKADRSAQIIEEARKAYPEAVFMLFTSSDFQGVRGANLKVLENELIDPGLFGGDRIIKIYLKDLDSQGVEVLYLIAQRLREGVTVIVDLPRINASYAREKPLPYKDDAKLKLETRKKHAISYIKGVGGSLEIFYPPEGQALLAFIADRAERCGFKLERPAAVYLAQACEGNLMAIDQSLKVLQMTLKPGTYLNIDEIDRFFAKDARFSGFEFTEALLTPDPLRALNILNSFCNGPQASLSESLALLLARTESALNAVYEARKQDLKSMAYADRTLFFMSFGLKTQKAQETVSRAALHMSEDLLNFLSLSLSKASRAFAGFNPEKAYLYLEEMAAAAQIPAVMNLSANED